GHAQVSRKQLLRQDRDGQADQDADNRSASADEKRFEEKLRENFFRRGTHSLANADLSRALLHGDQHDVHDANTADQQRNERNQDQQNGQRQRNGVRRAQDGTQRPHDIFRLGGMAALHEHQDFPLYHRHHFGRRGLGINRSHHFPAGVVLDQSKWNDDRFFLDLRQSISGHALAEDADDGKCQLSHVEILPDRI